MKFSNFITSLLVLFSLFVPVTSSAATLLTDNFTGTTINTGKWTEYDTAGIGGTTGDVQQNGSITITNSATGSIGSRALVSVDTFSSDGLEISAVVTPGGAPMIGYGDRVYNGAGNQAYLVYFNGITILGLVWKNTAMPNNVSCGTVTSGATYKMKVIPTGFEVYKNGSLVCTVTPSSGNLVNNKTVFFQSDSAISTFDDVLITDNSADPTAPDAPTSVTATPASTQMGLSWTAPASNGGSALTDYLVEYKLTSEPTTWTTFSDGTSTSTSATVTSLTNALSYDFRVSAINAIGTSTPSSTATATPSAPTVPGSPTGLLGVGGNMQVGLTWTAPVSNGGSALTDYLVEYKLTSEPTTWTTFSDGTSTSTSATVTSLTNALSYDFRVSAINAIGTSTPSSTETTSPALPTAPAAPTIGAVVSGDSQVSVSFTAGSDGGSAITGYTVTSSPGSVTATGSSSPIIVTGLTNGVAYTFTVTATNAIGTSTSSASSSTATPSQIDIANTAAFWLKADAIVGLNDSDPVTTWLDSSSNILNATQSTVGNKPIYKTNIINSQPIIRFDGINDVLATSSTSNSSAITYFAVVKSADSSSGYLSDLGGSNNSIIHGFSAGIWEYFNSPRTNIGTISTSQFQIITSRVGSSATGPLSVGSDVGIIAPWAGDVAEVIYFKSALSNNDYNAVYNYLNAKYFPPSVPDAPTNLTSSSTSGQVDLSWTAPDSNGGASITDYKVEYKLSTEPTTWTIFVDGTSAATSATVTGLTNGLSYNFRVSATNSVGTGAVSSTATATPHDIEAPSQVTGLVANGANRGARLFWIAPASDATITDYLIEYKLNTDSSWNTFSDGVSSNTKANVTNLDNGINYDFRVSAISSVGTGISSAVESTTPNAITTLAFVVTGESNAGGQAPNTNATAPELAPTDEVQIINTNTFLFEDLDIGTNNNMGHTGLTSNTTHGFELELANSTKDNEFPDNPLIYLVKTGHGGSRISQWDVGQSYWTQHLQRTAGAKAQLSEDRQWVVWISLGINDYLAGTTASAFKTGLLAHINKIKTDLPGAIVVLTQFQSMTNGGYATYNTAMEEIATTEPNVYVVDSTGAAMDDGNHWSYAGLKDVGSRMITITNNALGLIYPGIPTSLGATPAGTSVALSWTAPVSNGGSSITDYLVEYKTSAASNWTTFADGTSTSTSATVTGLTGSTAYNFRVSTVNANGAGNATSVNSTTTDGSAPSLSSITATPGNTTVAITWTTDEASSSIVDYGLTNAYGTSTAEADTSPRVTSHSVSLSSLVSCTTYHFRVKSNDAASNLATGSDATFTTTGCTGSADVLDEESDTIPTATGGTVELLSGQYGMELEIPAGATATDAIFQIKQLDSTEALSSIGTPNGLNIIGDYAYELKSLADINSSNTTFLEDITITISYSDQDVSGFIESSLIIYRWNGTIWVPLTGCVVDTSANTVTCTTANFSFFGLFGAASTSSGITSGSLPMRLALNNTCLPGQLFNTSTGQRCPLNTSPTSAFTITKTLKTGMIDIEIKTLQQYLNTHGYTLATTGAGSPGSETTKFGPLTKKAVIKFQLANSLTGDGVVGPMTRGMMQAKN